MFKIIRFYIRRIYYDCFLVIRGTEHVAKNLNISRARKQGVRVGEGCRFFSTNFSTEPYLIEIGHHVTITDGVQFITHDGGVWVFREKFPKINLFGKIKVGNNVFIGLNSIILPNTEIGDNTIIAAGSVVKGKYEGNIIIGGVPAKKIGTIDGYFEKNKSLFRYDKK